MIILKKLDPNKDITKKYLNWMNDPIVHKFTEQRYKKHSMKMIKDFVIEKNKSKDEFLYGIFLKKKLKAEHIGNIKLGPIDKIHKTAFISYFIGEKQFWNKGYTSKAFKIIFKKAKQKKIKKLKAGLYALNKNSEGVLKKNGFSKEGILSSEVVFNNKRYSYFFYGKKLND